MSYKRKVENITSVDSVSHWKLLNLLKNILRISHAGSHRRPEKVRSINVSLWLFMSGLIVQRGDCYFEGYRLLLMRCVRGIVRSYTAVQCNIFGTPYFSGVYPATSGLEIISTARTLRKICMQWLPLFKTLYPGVDKVPVSARRQTSNLLYRAFFPRWPDVDVRYLCRSALLWGEMKAWTVFAAGIYGEEEKRYEELPVGSVEA